MSSYQSPDDLAYAKQLMQAANKEELAETVFIAAALRAGAAVGHGLMAMRVFDEHAK